MLPGDMGRTGRQWNVISEPYPGLRGYATAYSWNPLRKGLLTGIYVLPNSSRFISMRFTPLNSRIFLHLNPKSHLLSNLKGRRLQIYLRPFSWLILRLRPEAPGLGRLPNKQIFTDGPQGRACENSFCGHRSIACHLAAPPESSQKREKRRPFLLDLRFSGFLQSLCCGLHDRQFLFVH